MGFVSFLFVFWFSVVNENVTCQPTHGDKIELWLCCSDFVLNMQVNSFT